MFPITYLQWHHEAIDDSDTVRNLLFIMSKLLSIHQRQRHSVALVTAYGPTPSYDMTRKDLRGQMCVIISVMRVCHGVSDEFSLLCYIKKMNIESRKKQLGEKDRSCYKGKKNGKKRSRSSHFLLLSTSSCAEALVPPVMCHNKAWWRMPDSSTSGHDPHTAQPCLSMQHKGWNCEWRVTGESTAELRMC